MGRIKGTLVKRSTRDLLEVHSSKFSEDFELNKKIVSDSVPGIGKKLRNSISGYISRLKKKEAQEKK